MKFITQEDDAASKLKRGGKDANEEYIVILNGLTQEHTIKRTRASTSPG